MFKSSRSNRSIWRVQKDREIGWRLVAEVDGEPTPIKELVDDLEEVLARWKAHRPTSGGARLRSGQLAVVWMVGRGWRGCPG